MLVGTHPFQLPARLVVRAVMHKLAGIAIAAEAGLLVILADIWLVVKSDRRPDVHIGPERAVGACAFFVANSVFPAEAFSIVGIVVHALVCVAGAFSAGGACRLCQYLLTPRSADSVPYTLITAVVSRMLMLDTKDIQT